MAGTLTDEEIFFKDWEPKLKHRFFMYVDGIPSYLIKMADRPKLAQSPVVLDHVNVERKVKGKSRWQDISITLYDPIVPSGAQACIDWIRQGHESVTGRDGYSDQYKKRLTFHALGPVGDKVEEWTLNGAFINNVDWGNADWSDDTTVMDITLTLSYDYAVLQY